MPSSFRDQFPAESETATARRQWLNAIVDEYMTQFVFDGTVNRDLVVADEVDCLHSKEINGYRCRAFGCESPTSPMHGESGRWLMAQGAILV